MRVLFTVAFLLVVVCVAPTAAAPAPPEAQPVLNISVRAIGSPYGPRGAPSVFFEGEQVVVGLSLVNQTSHPVTVGDRLRPDAWLRDTRLALSRLGERDWKPEGKLVYRKTQYLPVLKGAVPQASHVLYPGDYIETEWEVVQQDGRPFPEGTYIVTGDVASRWPTARGGSRPFRIAGVTGRLDQLNRTFHIAVRQRWAGKFQESLATLRQLLKLCPNSPTAFAEMAAAHEGLRQYDEAIELYERAISILKQNTLPPEEELNQITKEHWSGGLGRELARCRQKKAGKG